MKYIILAAGKGTRLYPLTLNCPKCLLRLDEKYTIVQKMIDSIRLYDSKANIVAVVGFMASAIVKATNGTEFVYNPFYATTNSIASLWFAREHLNDEVTIINGDIVTDNKLAENVITRSFEYPLILVDSSKKSGDYNVQTYADNVLVMSKELSEYYGEYAGITKLDKKTALSLKYEIMEMVELGNVDRWYEDALVQLIFDNYLKLKYIDVSDYEWTEVDCVDDLYKAKSICKNNA